MTLKEILERYELFKDSPYLPVVSEMLAYAYSGTLDEAAKLDDQLPSTKTMLSQLVAECKGKSVYTNFRKLVENKVESDIEGLKTLSSLVTHSLIQESKYKYYRLLTKELLGKLQELIA